MTHNPSRKHFFASLFGVVAAAAVLPKLLAKAATGRATSTKSASLAPSSPLESMPITVRTDARAVAREAV